VVLVVGTPNSSNSNLLREIAQKLDVPAYLIDAAEDIDPDWLAGAASVGVTAGASAPDVLVQRVLQRLRDNLDDLVIMSTPPRDMDIVSQVFMPNPLVVTAPLSHPLAQQKAIPLAQLSGERCILRERGSGTRLACDQHFEKAGFAPLVRLELGSNEAIKQAVAGGMGLAVLSRHALGEHLVDEALAVLDVDGFPIQSSWYIVYLQGKRLSPLAQAFLQYLSAHASDWRQRQPALPVA